MESLLNKVGTLEYLLCPYPAERLLKLCPDADFSQELGGTFEKDTWFPDKSSNALGSSSTAVAPQAPNVDAEDLPPSDDEIISQRTLTHNLKQMHINPAHMRFFGKSSSIMFIQTAIEAKHEFTGTEMPKREDRNRPPLLRSKRPQFWGIHPVGAYLSVCLVWD